ncbi:MAG: hypothetical protein Q4B85_00895 [Lachnospiraceae bacterium]|nr:hypothetical protein [Lachnospiraceae bacterium]
MRRFKALPAAMLLALTLSVTGCGAQKETEKNRAENTEEALESAIEAAQESQKEALKKENLGSNEGVDLSAYEKVYGFTLGEEEYYLSCPVQMLLDNGWEFSDDNVTMDGTEVVTLNEAVAKGTKFDAIETPDFNLYKTIEGETYQVMMGLYSDSNQPKTLGEFRLGYLYVKQDLGVSLEMNTGITFGATEEEVKGVYGEPVTQTEEILCYQFTEDTVALMPDRPEFLNFYMQEGKVYMISMQYFPVLSD